MRYFAPRIVSVLLSLSLAAASLPAAGLPINAADTSVSLLSTEALANRGSFYLQNMHGWEASSLQALHWTINMARFSIQRADAAFFAVSVSAGLLAALLNPQQDHRQFIEERKRKFLKYGLFAAPLNLTWTDKTGEQHMTIRFEFAADDKQTYDEIRETILRPEIAFAKKGVLSAKHAEMVLWLADPAHRETLEAYTDPILERNPLKIIARDQATGKVVGFVYPVFVQAKNADQLPNTWIGMSKWLETYDPMPRNLSDWVMGDIWFTGGSNAAVAHAMLDASYELGNAMGISRFYAYSNPKALPSYMDKNPGRLKDLGERDYAARIIASFVLENLKTKTEKIRLRTWRQFYKQTRRLTYRHAKGLEARDISTRIIGKLMQTKTNLGLSDTPQREDFLRVINELQTPFEKGGYVVNDPAITFHLKRGSKLVRIITGAFPTILEGPGIGGGNSFVMEYSVHLRHRFLMRFGESIGLRYARWHLFRERRHLPRTPPNGSPPAAQRLTGRAA